MKKLSFIFAAILIFFSAHSAFAGGLMNPLGEGVTDPRKIVGGIVLSILGIIGTIALLIFIYGGALIFFSFGKEDKIHEGRNTILYAAIGLIIIFSSYALVEYVLTAITTIKP